jgi:hypothetical protein
MTTPKTLKATDEARVRKAPRACGLGELRARGPARAARPRVGGKTPDPRDPGQLSPEPRRHRPYGSALAFAPPALLARAVRRALRRPRS